MKTNKIYKTTYLLTGALTITGLNYIVGTQGLWHIFGLFIGIITLCYATSVGTIEWTNS